jgi:anti-sigma factor RsiW
MTDCPYLHDDGAYVLGALSPGERARFEHHLAGCAACRNAVAEVAVLPALLGRLTLDDLRLPAGESREPVTGPAAEQVVEPAGGPAVGPAAESGARPVPVAVRQPDQVMAGLVDATRTRRRRERRVARWGYAATGVAAAAVALAVGLAWPSAPNGPVAQSPTPAPTTASAAPTTASPAAMVAMTQLRPGLSVRAEVGLRSGPWGTEVVLHCWYSSMAGRTGPFAYQLVAYGPNRTADPLGSWTSGPGDDVWMTGITRYSIGDLTRIQLVGSRGTALLNYEVP